jgi:nitrile hydratase subunit beta
MTAWTLGRTPREPGGDLAVRDDSSVVLVPGKPAPSNQAGATMMRAYHDLGGRPAGPIDRTEHELEPWEKRVDAIMQLLSAPERRIVGVDELRRAIEGLGAEEYDRLGYYERWIAGIAKILLEKGVLTTEELGRKLDEVRARDGVTP